MNRPKIPNFTVTQFCGRGASGEVWIGVDSNGVSRALKLMDLADEEKAKVIEHENTALSAYRNIVNRNEYLLDILYLGKTSKYLYYVTELADNVAKLPGEYEPDTLTHRLLEHSFSPKTIIETVTAIIEGVSFLHSNGLAHCDLKPENIIFVDGKLRIADPGLVCRGYSDPHAGTDGFRPPWKSTAIQNDIYAIGKILYCMFSRSSASDYPSLPPGIDFKKIRRFNEVTMRCCDDNPAIRYQSISELLDGIRQLSAASLLQKLNTRKQVIAICILSFVLLASLVGNLLQYRLAQKEVLSLAAFESGWKEARTLAEQHDTSNAYNQVEYLRNHFPNAMGIPAFAEFHQRLRQKHFWYSCFNWLDSVGPDLVLLLDEFKIVPQKEKEEIFSNIIRSNPQVMNSAVFLTNYYYLLRARPGMEQQAQAMLNRITNLPIQPEHSALQTIYLTRLANFLLNEGESERALALANQACAMTQTLHIPYTLRAAIRIRRGEYKEAVKDLRTSIVMKPANFFAIRLLGQVPESEFQ